MATVFTLATMLLTGVLVLLEREQAGQPDDKGVSATANEAVGQ